MFSTRLSENGRGNFMLNGGEICCVCLMVFETVRQFRHYLTALGRSQVWIGSFNLESLKYTEISNLPEQLSPLSLANLHKYPLVYRCHFGSFLERRLFRQSLRCF